MSLEWMDRGACREVEPEMFFLAPKANPAEALNVCRSCPVLDQCRAYAMSHDLEGVWGGTTAEERRLQRDPKSVRPQCGTYAGASRHRRLKEAMCRPCMDAANEFKRELRAKRERANV